MDADCLWAAPLPAPTPTVSSNSLTAEVRFMRALAFVIALALLASLPAAGQTPSKSWTVPRTPDGQPDLQGVWTNATITPLERPAELAGKEFLTEAEARDFEKSAFAQ